MLTKVLEISIDFFDTHKVLLADLSSSAQKLGPYSSIRGESKRTGINLLITGDEVYVFKICVYHDYATATRVTCLIFAQSRDELLSRLTSSIE